MRSITSLLLIADERKLYALAILRLFMNFLGYKSSNYEIIVKDGSGSGIF